MNLAQLEPLYAAMPVWMQNAAVTASGVYHRYERYGHEFHTYLRFLRDSEWWSEEEISRYRDEMVRLTIRRASRLPGYRELWSEAGVDPRSIYTAEDLVQLPVLEKEHLKRNIHSFVNHAIPSRQIIKLRTSGTSGVPLVVPMTRTARQRQWAIWWRHRARFGVRLGDYHLSVGARVPVAQGSSKTPLWRRDRINNRVILSAYHLDDAATTHVANLLSNERFIFISGYPSILARLAQDLLRQGYRNFNRPLRIFTGSDALLPQMGDLFRSVFGVNPTEQYGMVEFAGNVSKCAETSWHLDFECCHLDIEPLAGQTTGRLIFTGFHNEALPLVRYAVGDMGASLQHSDCRCGRKSATLARLEGRTEDYLVASDGRLLAGFNQVLEYAEDAIQAQLHQASDLRITIRVVPGPTWRPTASSQPILRELSRRFGGSLPPVGVEIVDAVELIGGKARAVISEVPVDDRIARAVSRAARSSEAGR